MNSYERTKIHELMGNLETANALLEEYLEIAFLVDDLIEQACAHRLAGDIARHTDVQRAKEHYARARETFVNAGDDLGAREIDNLVSRFQ